MFEVINRIACGIKDDHLMVAAIADIQLFEPLIIKNSLRIGKAGLGTVTGNDRFESDTQGQLLSYNKSCQHGQLKQKNKKNLWGVFKSSLPAPTASHHSQFLYISRLALRFLF